MIYYMNMISTFSYYYWKRENSNLGEEGVADSLSGAMIKKEISNRPLWTPLG